MEKEQEQTPLNEKNSSDTAAENDKTENEKKLKNEFENQLNFSSGFLSA